MNNPNPITPQFLSDQKNKSRSRLKMVFYCVLAVHFVGLMAMLVQGCKREQPAPPPENVESIVDTNLPPVDTNLPPASIVDTNLPPVVEQIAPSTTEYVVVKGDSFYTIGKKLGVSWKAIGEANPGVDSAKLKIGQKLMIPAASATTAVSGGAAPVATTSETTYVVKSGDTLTKIAKSHGTTYKALKSYNNLATDKIKVGQKLKIPVKETAPAPVTETIPAPEAMPVAPTTAPAQGQ